jgi:MFS family permease
MATGAPPATATAATGGMDRYLWLILLSAFLAWMLDSVALNVFNLVLTPSLRDLLGTAARGEIAEVGGLVVATKLFAWGIGGTLFGVLTDRLGRARIMLVRLLAPELRGATLGGLLSAMALMVGAFAATTFVPSWIGELTGGGPAAAVRAASYFAMLLNAGAVAGYLVLIWVVRVLGRRGCFFVYCLGSLVVAVVLFTRVADAGTLLLLAPVAGFFVLGGFGVFAVYLPELFPTEVRATGQGICFNLARVVTGFGTLATGFLVGRLGSYPAAGLLVSLAFTVGLLTIWIAPETRGRTLQDTDRAADRAADRVAVEP